MAIVKYMFLLGKEIISWTLVLTLVPRITLALTFAINIDVIENRIMMSN